MSSIFGFNEHIADGARWVTRTVAVSGSGTTTSTLPATNIFTKNPSHVFERTGIVDSDTLTVDVQLADATSPPPALYNAGALWGLLNCYAIRESTGELIDVTVHFRESISAFTGPYIFDRSRTIWLREQQGGAPRQAWLARGMTGIAGTHDPITAPDFAKKGGNTTAGFVRMNFTNTATLGTWTLRIGRLVRLSGIRTDIEPTIKRGGSDKSEIVRSFGGFPFVLQRARSRSYAGRIINITDRMARGVFVGEPGGSSDYFRPSIETISRLSGRSAEVCVLERDNVADTNSLWQTQPVFGLLESDMIADRISNTSDKEGLSACDIDVRESPQF